MDYPKPFDSGSPLDKYSLSPLIERLKSILSLKGYPIKTTLTGEEFEA